MKKAFSTKLAAGIMACTMAACLVVTAGCMGKAKPDFEMPEGGFDVTKPVTITFYHQMGANLQTILNDYIATFNKMYPNITVEHTSQGDWNGIRKTVTTQIQAGKQPNISFCYPDHVALYNRSNAVQPLNGFLADGAFKDITVPTVKVDQYGEYVLDESGNRITENVPLNLTQEQQDMYNPTYFSEGYMFEDPSKMYTLPWIKSTEMMFYNADFFEENNLKVPETWDEMEEVCKKIKEIDPDAIPFGYDSEENWFITMCEQLKSGFTSISEPKFNFDNEKNREFVQRFKDWYDKGYFTTSALANVNYVSDFFLTKQIYMAIGSTGGATYNTDTSGEKVPFEVGIAPVPQESLDNIKIISQGPSVCIFKSDDPQEVLASWLFVKYFTTNPLYQTEVAMNNGYMPVLTKQVMDATPAYADWVAKANGSNYLTAQAVKVGMEHEAHYFVSPAFYGSSDAREQVGLLMQAALPGTKTIDEAFRDALATCTSKYGK